MIIFDIDKLIDMFLDVAEDEIISSMHQNYVFFDRENIKANLKILLDKNENNITIRQTRETYLN